MDRQWKLGEDLAEVDNILDQITFDDVILALHHERVINEQSLQSVVKDIMEQRMQDFEYLLENNIDEIIARAKRGRE